MTDICPVCSKVFNPYRNSNDRKLTCAKRSCSSWMREYSNHRLAPCDKWLKDELEKVFKWDCEDVMI